MSSFTNKFGSSTCYGCLGIDDGDKYKVNVLAISYGLCHMVNIIWPISYFLTFIFRDKTFGWHGYRSGLALYYFNLIHVQDEDHEVSITSNMNIYAQAIWRIR